MKSDKPRNMTANDIKPDVKKLLSGVFKLAEGEIVLLSTVLHNDAIVTDIHSLVEYSNDFEELIKGLENLRLQVMQAFYSQDAWKKRDKEVI